jgi:hypothetical protein
MGNPFHYIHQSGTGTFLVGLIIGSQKMKLFLLPVGRILKSKKGEKRTRKEKRDFSSGYNFHY